LPRNDAIVDEPSSGFLVTDSDGKWCLRPTPRRAMRPVAISLFVGLLAVVGGVLMDIYYHDNEQAYWRHFHVFTVLGSLTAVLLWGAGIWAWSIRHAAVSIDTQTGEVFFGNKQLCGPHTVASVLIRCASDLPEDEECFFFEFRLTDGTVVSVPSPAFVDIGDVTCTTALAEQVAAKLKVSVARDY